MASQTPALTAWTSLLGDDALVRRQVRATLFSAVTYVLYAGITAVQVWQDLLALETGLWLTASSLLANALFYAVVRSGRVREGDDPGLARAQMLVGIVFMLVAYALLGPAAPALLIVMCSHVAYAMFWMAPRQVFHLAAGSLLALALTMGLAHRADPERYPLAVQLSTLLYALLVVPMVATLAGRVTALTRRLQQQKVELQAAMLRLSELATRDELTRAHNRRHMTELVRSAQARMSRSGSPVALALLDLDHFKQVNDRHGHAVGDAVLRDFAALVRGHLRAGDELARWGGEEFLVLMPDTRAPAAVQALELLQEMLSSGAESGRPGGLTVSFSAGVTALTVDDTLEQALERADRAMYRAKTAGRARCLRD